MRNLVVGLLLGCTEIKEQTTIGHLALVAVGNRGIRGAALGAILDRIVDGGTRGKGRLEGEMDAARRGRGNERVFGNSVRRGHTSLVSPHVEGGRRSHGDRSKEGKEHVIRLHGVSSSGRWFE